ncbi:MULTISPECIES: hypothetical protein [Bacillus]|nr:MULTISPECIES: hypothetical protein [Bacillus]EEM55919.1 hypothetical protein bthur0007_62490 [Bacillus thuringiensis serovar monterrey BGSC 4AJ1]MDX9637514.1 hypothetical protein [Bacillus sp. PBL-C9]
MVINNILSYITFAIGAIIMKLDTTKLEALNTKEVTEIEGGGAGKWIFRAGVWFFTEYPKSGGPEIEASYKYGQPGRRM